MKKLLLLSSINGILFALPFLFDVFFFLIFFSTAFLFFNLEKIQSKIQTSTYLFICVSIWQITALFWLHHDSEISFWSTNLLIFFLILVPFIFLLFYFLCISNLRINRCWKLTFFIAIWIIYEITFLEWELRFPMMPLGIVLGNFPLLIQFYSYTGVIGGTIWILMVNFILLDTIKTKKIYVLLTVTILPILLSLFIYIATSNREKEEVLNVVVCNLALNENKDFFEQSFLNVENAIDSSTNIILCPEGLLHLSSTSFPVNKYFSKIKRLILSKSRNAAMIFGCSSNTPASNTFTDSSNYNMIIQCDSSGYKNIRNKIFLVPFGEFIPFESLIGDFKLVKNAVKYPVSINYDYDNIFLYNEIKILPLICYELYFSNFIRRYFTANSIGIICCVSNEYAIPNRVYYTQLIRASRIQAITFKTPVIKSTINGYSSIINANGNIISSEYNTNEALKGKVTITLEHTFYSKYGYLFVCILLLLIPVIIFIHKKL